MVAIPYTFSNGTTPDASEFNANFETLADAQDQVRNANIVDNAGIDKSKLAHPFVPGDHGVVLVPKTSGTDLSATSMFTIGGTGEQQEIHRERISLAPGEVASLCLVEFWMEDHTAGGGGEVPVVDVLVDGVQITGQAINMDTDQAYYAFGNASPIAAPLIPLVDGSVIVYRLGKSGAGTPSIRGLYITRRVVKRDLVA